MDITLKTHIYAIWTDPKARILVYIFAILIVINIWIFQALAAQNSSLENTNERYHILLDLSNSYADNNQLLDNLNNSKTYIDNIEHQLKYPLGQSEIYEELYTLASKSKVSIKSQSFKQGENKKEIISKIELTGSYMNLKRFLIGLNGMNNYVIPQKVSLSQGTGNLTMIVEMSINGNG